MSVVSRSARRGGLVLAVLALVLSLVGQASPASAVTLTAPTNLAPASGSFGDNPTLSWDRVTGATNYAVEVSASSGFGSVLWTGTTVNKQAVPSVRLPEGPLFWRVRAQAGATLGPWAQGGFTRTAYAAPSGLAPADGAILPQPTQAARLSWDASSGATGYTVQVAANSDFSFVTNTITTQNTSVIIRNLSNTTYYWRVKAAYSSSYSSPWTSGRAFEFGTLPKAVVSTPANGSSTDEPVFSWQPIAGAAEYEIQVSTSSSFSTTVISKKDIFATSYAPGQSLAKGTYYWRVRGFDAAGRGRGWADVDVWSFTRTFAAQPSLANPANAATVTEPVFFQWAPIKLAESYELQLSTSSGFGSIDQSCTTVSTTYAPTGPGDCWPAAGGTYYWRVIGFDGPTPLNGGGAQSTSGGGAQVRSFTYSPTRPTMTAPLSGSLSVPTFRWNTVYGAAQYKVTITGPTNLTVTTNSTSFTPRTALAVGSYKWQVQAVSRTGEVGPAYATGEQPSFSVVAQAAPTQTVPNPTVGNQSVTRFPTLTWNSVISATRYQIQVRTVGSGTWTTLPDYYVYPAGDDSASTWAPGNYEWRTIAWNGTTQLTTSLTLGTFTIGALAAPTGQKVSLTGLGSTDGSTSCVKALSSVCTDLRQTPVLAWSSNADAVYYKVHLATNSALSAPVSGYPKTVDNIRSMPLDQLADGTYFWAVQACRTATDCTAAGSATNSFTKAVKSLQLQTPSSGTVIDSPNVTLTWRDFLDTNQDSGVGAATDNAGVSPTYEVRQYRVQVATDAAFSALVSDAVVNQTQFTEPSKLYAPGTTYYWRVQATDGSGNVLPWSSSRTFSRTIPLVTLNAPTSSIGGSLALTWNAATAVASYDFELYKDAASGSPVKIASSQQLTVPAYVPAAPLTVSSKPYAWRVRPRDAGGNVGRWTAMTQFTVTGPAPTLIAPAAGALLVPAADALFTWNGVPGATSYRWERRNAATGSVVAKVSTVSPAYAPTAKIGTGSWEWRAVALDTSGQSLGASAWRAFSVDVTGPKVKSYTPTGTVSLSTNFKVTFDESVKNLTSSTFTITASGGSNPLSTTVTLDAARKTATLNPSSNLVSGKKYVVRLTTGVTDDLDNPMTAFSWTVTGK